VEVDPERLYHLIVALRMQDVSRARFSLPPASVVSTKSPWKQHVVRYADQHRFNPYADDHQSHKLRKHHRHDPPQPDKAHQPVSNNI
jgi:hypothetical protein